ncbi:hypothetical protein OESDEN_10307 [Oesophagostomum dentatum]|uniref:Uncharacterized protein n=1 Tax=Oesophagostomum dentatum TaxID=61180 RepID=A0A0B1T376_OESDE|nr:hypothetical protein OESDEN_10307 [Oesophagostomum dentatum]
MTLHFSTMSLFYVLIVVALSLAGCEARPQIDPNQWINPWGRK